MSFDFESLREGNKDCPSDVTLQRVRNGETTSSDVQSHLKSCSSCAARLEAQARGFDAYPEANPQRMLRAIRLGVDSAPKPWTTQWVRWVRLLAVPVAAAAAFALIPRRSLETTRSKGPSGLHVFRLAGGAAQEAISGDAFRPGEPLRFQVDLATDKVVKLVGVDASGALYPVWPAEARESRLLQAGAGQTLEGAVSLDDSPGSETLHLVTCAPGTTPDCHSQGAEKALVCPAGCASTPFVLRKHK